jgi:hypothetical protein
MITTKYRKLNSYNNMKPRLTSHFSWIISIVVTIAALFIAKPVFAQLPKVQGDIVSYSASNIITTQGTGQYTVPSSQQGVVWADVIGEMLRFNFTAAHTKAAGVGYQVTEFTDASSQKKYFVLEKLPQGTNFWGKYVVNPLPVRPLLVIQSPHPVSDLNTESQGAYIFKEVGAVLFCVAGTHRCNDTESSPCAGTTTVCSGDNVSSPFRRSDQAHAIDGTFQRTTQVVVSTIPKFVIVHVHGFNKDAGEPDVIISNGTTKVPTAPFIDYALVVKQQLQAIDATLTFKVAHIDLDWTMLTGTTNMQGRLVNNSPNPCGNSASMPTGQFVHIEQARIGLRDTPANWNKLTEAIARAVPATTITPPVSQLSVTPSMINVAAPGGALSSIIIMSNVSWTAASNQTWLQISAQTGMGNGQISATAQANSSTGTRQATITLTGGGLQRTVTVLQMGVAAQLTVTPLTLNIADTGGALPGISITSNTSWTVMSNQLWAQLSVQSGTGNSQVGGSIQANTSTTSRQATITVSGGGLQHSVVVTQQGVSVQLTVTPSMLSLPTSGGVLPVISITANTSWTAAANQPWIVLSAQAGIGNSQLSGSVQANGSTLSSTLSRQAIVTVSGGGLQRMVAITQQGVAPQLAVSVSTLNIGVTGSELPAIMVTSNTSWAATTDKSWVQLSTQSGTNTGQVSGSVQANMSTIPRQATITITAGGLQRTVSILQPGVLLQVDTSRIVIPKAGRQNVAISINANVSWSAVTSQPWLTFKNGGGISSGSMTFDVPPNPILSARTAAITISGFGQTRSLLVEQEANIVMSMMLTLGFDSQNIITIVPNPAYEILTVQHTVRTLGGTHFRIINSLGETVMEQSLRSQESGRHEESISVRRLPTGTYMMIVSSPQGVSFASFVIFR